MKRTLRKSINYLLIAITTCLFILTASIDDMTIQFIPVYLLLVATLGINIYILIKYGNKNLLYGKER